MNGSAWGGSEELWFKTAIYLATHGNKVACAVHDWKEKEERLKKLESLGCKVYRLQNKKKIKASFIKKPYLKQQLKIQLRKTINSLPVNDYELVIVNQGGFEVCTQPWKTFYKRLNRCALLFHNYNEQQKFSPAQKKSLSLWTDKAASNLFAANKMHKVLQKQIGHEIKNASVFINPLSFEPPKTTTPYPPLKEGNYILSIFAALDVNRKAQDKLIRILSAQKWKDRPWQLHLYGEGNDKFLLQKLINTSGLQHKVFLKGHTSNVVLAIQQTHMVLQITNIDAMPLSVMEAMATSRPLVVSRIGDMSLWIQEDENGWVCDTDETAIDACLEKAWQARDGWAEMGRKSFLFFQEKFPVDVEVSFVNLLNKS
jgi:glycosyltransferase involved in cell wall biosynthesis